MSPPASHDIALLRNRLSEPKARIETALVLTSLGKMASTRSAERLLQTIADRQGKRFPMDRVVELPTQQDVILDTGREAPEALLWFYPTFCKATKGCSVRGAQCNGQLKWGVDVPALDSLRLQVSSGPDEPDDVTE